MEAAWVAAHLGRYPPGLVFLERYRLDGALPIDERPTADAVPGRGRGCEGKKTPQRPL